MSLSTPALKAHLIKTLGAKGEYLVAHMKQRFIEPQQTQAQCLAAAARAANAAPVAGQGIAGSLAKAQSGTCCQRQNAHWGGYYVDESGVTGTNGVESDFNAVFTSCTPDNPTCSISEWVGIGGVNGNGDLDQVGVNMITHKAWWCAWDNPYKDCHESGLKYPNALFTVNQGDNIYGNVSRYSPGVWEFYIEDTSTGSYSDYEYAWSPNATTADWITELNPSGDGTIPQFSDITYGNDYWFDSNGNPYGASHEINDNNIIEGVENFTVSGQWANPCSVYNGGVAFTYYWHLATCPQ